MALTRRAALAALVGALIVLAFRTVPALLAVDTVLVAAIAADLALAGAIGPLRITRGGDNRVLLGERAVVTVTVDNQGKRSLNALLRASWQPSAHAEPGRAALRVPRGARTTVSTTLTPDRRGDKMSPAVVVRSMGPLGLAGRQSTVAAPWTIRVLPPFGSRRHLPEKLSMLRQLEGQHRSLLRGAGTEFDSLREYVIGDDVRSIDWRAAARRSDVMVRTWRPERDRRILVVLDTGRTAAGRVSGTPRLDASMDATLLLAALATRAGDRIDLIAFDRRIRARVVGAPRSSVLASFTSAMAPLEAELTETDVAAMASAVLTVARRRCLVILLTDLNPAVIEESLLPRLPTLVSRNVIMIASVSDPRLTEMAGSRGDAARMYDAAAAQGALAQRERISALVRRQGASVVDAPPDRLPAALADAYLGLKASGRL
ncbi:MAG TPA: DUF58 domain-containing protein [Streptosporangiaceae bacterium]|nr:DUF58 domain-containing protein [Streptosporangiaceae bacterium]